VGGEERSIKRVLEEGEGPTAPERGEDRYERNVKERLCKSAVEVREDAWFSTKRRKKQR